MTAQRPNERAIRLGYVLQNQIAAEITNALEAVSERLARADGYPTQTIGASPPVGEPRPEMTGPCASCERPRPCRDHDGATLTSTERAADTRYRELAHVEQIRDDLAAIETMIRDFQRYLRKVLGNSTAEDITQAVPMCRDNQTGKHAADEWGDALCPMPASKGGLCALHYDRWYKARRRDGIQTRADHEPAA